MLINTRGKSSGPVMNKMTSSQKKKVVAGSTGNAVEYIDWAIYASLAPIFAPKFFPSGNEGTALLSALAIFAAGFIMRPIGGAALGSFADRHGRKKGLALSILIMSLGGFVIAFSPTYEQVGWFASIILVLARLAQGFAAGGEYGTSSSYLVESAAEGRRAFAGSFQQVSITAAILAASVLSFIITSSMSSEALSEWGWRLAFATASALGFLVLWFRSTVGESESFEEMKEKEEYVASPLKSLIKDHRRSVMWIFLITGPVALLHYIWVIYMPAFANSAYDIPLSLTLLSSLIATAVLIVLLPIFGNLSDKYGRKPMLLFSCGGSLLLSFPAFYLLDNGFWALLCFQLLAVFFLAPYLASLAAIMSEQFPASVRTIGIGLPYALAVAIFGGTAPYIITAMSTSGLLGFIWIYPAVMALAGIVAFSLIKETSRLPLDR